MDRKAWLWSPGALLIGSVFGYGGISRLSRLLITRGIIPIPAAIPEFMGPTSMADLMLAYDSAVGGLKGNWLSFIGLSIILVFNILGEEFWWRGIVLPRQELSFGKWTWAAHGTMWFYSIRNIGGLPAIVLTLQPLLWSHGGKLLPLHPGDPPGQASASPQAASRPESEPIRFRKAS